MPASYINGMCLHCQTIQSVYVVRYYDIVWCDVPGYSYLCKLIANYVIIIIYYYLAFAHMHISKWLSHRFGTLVFLIICKNVWNEPIILHLHCASPWSVNTVQVDTLWREAIEIGGIGSTVCVCISSKAPIGKWLPERELFWDSVTNSQLATRRRLWHSSCHHQRCMMWSDRT